jgi:hypothetical protein
MAIRRDALSNSIFADFKPQNVYEMGSRIIAFNETNDLALPPDPEFVRTLKKPFPGTLVSLKFRLRSEDLAKVAEGLSEDEYR